jgi:hypothetical protein
MRLAAVLDAPRLVLSSVPRQAWRNCLQKVADLTLGQFLVISGERTLLMPKQTCAAHDTHVLPAICSRQRAASKVSADLPTQGALVTL